MTLIRRLLQPYLPKGQVVQQPSVTWELVCPNGHVGDLTDPGGLRVVARGARRLRGTCAQCGTKGWLDVREKDRG